MNTELGLSYSFEYWNVHWITRHWLNCWSLFFPFLFWHKGKKIGTVIAWGIFSWDLSIRKKNRTSLLWYLLSKILNTTENMLTKKRQLVTKRSTNIIIPKQKIILFISLINSFFCSWLFTWASNSIVSSQGCTYNLGRMGSTSHQTHCTQRLERFSLSLSPHAPPPFRVLTIMSIQCDIF